MLSFIFIFGHRKSKAVHLELAVHNTVVHTNNLLLCFHLFDADFYCIFLIFKRSNCFERNFAFVLHINGLTYLIQNQNSFSIPAHTQTHSAVNQNRNWWLVWRISHSYARRNSCNYSNHVMQWVHVIPLNTLAYWKWPDWMWKSSKPR